MTSFLLVHGAWQGAWVWDDVLARLSAEGVDAEALDLPGSGDDPTPTAEVTLAGYAEAIIAKARAGASERCVLVGHSMAGAAITAAASMAPSVFEKLVYVCAFLPRPGESVAELGKQSHALGAPGPQAEPIDGGSALRLRPASIEETFLHDCPEQAAAGAVTRFRPQPTAPLGSPATWSDGFETLPKRYIVCTRDRAVSPTLQALMAARAGVRDVHTLDSGHEPFFSKPAELVDLLVSSR